MLDPGLTPLGHLVGVRPPFFRVACRWGQTLQPVVLCLLINTTRDFHCQRGTGPIMTFKNGAAAEGALKSVLVWNTIIYNHRGSNSLPHRFLKLSFFIPFPDTLDCLRLDQPGSSDSPSFIIFNLPSLIQPWCITCLRLPAQKPVLPIKLNRDAHDSLRYGHMHAGSSSRPTPALPAPKQFIEASLHGHSFWNSNCYMIWLQVLSPLHWRANLKRPFLRSTLSTQWRISSLNAIIFTSFAWNNVIF